MLLFAFKMEVRSVVPEGAEIVPVVWQKNRSRLPGVGGLAKTAEQVVAPEAATPPGF